MKLAARFKDAPNLSQCILLLVPGNVVEHEGGQYSVERGFRIRQVIPKSLVEAD
jgi:hypothetical protein